MPHLFHYFQHRKPQKGFTLIELLVVIAIIGILSSVVLSSLNSARMKARDAVRFSDLRNVKIAMEVFYDDNDRYPNRTDTDCSWDVGNEVNPTDPFISELETAGLFSRTPREKTLFAGSPPCYGYTYIYTKIGSGSPCNGGRPFSVFAVLFERPHAQLGLPTDDIDTCECGYAGDTCYNASRYGVLFRE